MKRAAPGILLLILAWLTGCLFPCGVETRARNQEQSPPVKWNEVLKRNAEWYGSEDAVRIADNVLLYQRNSGGWPKNIDMAAALTASAKTKLVKEKDETDSTIDNGGTYTQLRYLARVYAATKLDRHKESFMKGVDYLLKAQYANGGWPQFFPLRRGYYSHITYNDDAMINVMELLRDISQNKSPFAFVDDSLRKRAVAAVNRGVECILKTQVIVQGQRTVWCAQHDEVTFKAAAARAFEPASLSGHESVAIVRFLMKVERPTQATIESIESAVAWFEKTRITGFRWEETRAGNGVDRVLVRDAEAGPLWARFYEIGTNRPIFTGRDAIIRYDVSQIEAERRNGYRWYTDAPEKLLKADYAAWRTKWRT